MRRVWTLVILAGMLLCTASACTEEKKQDEPNAGFKEKPELKSLPPPSNPGGGQPNTAKKGAGGNTPKAE
jgi:hypothetical protein